MDARRMRAALVAVLLIVSTSVASAASYRTQNFLVTAATPQLAREIGDAAEGYRRSLALEWIGRELPPWQDKCPITAQVSTSLLPGGVTQFYFDRGRPHNWTMSVQGSRERVLDSVVPHEVLHTIFATHFGGPLPRWADEGACTVVEHSSERSKQERLLYRFLQTQKGIPFNEMYRMSEYPNDPLPLYSQGYSLTRFLIAQGGKRRFVEYVGDGMRTRNWQASTKKHYGFENLSDLQVRWLAWVGDGGNDQLAANYSVAPASAQSPVGAATSPVAAAASPVAQSAPQPTAQAAPRQNTAQQNAAPMGRMAASTRGDARGSMMSYSATPAPRGTSPQPPTRREPLVPVPDFTDDATQPIAVAPAGNLNPASSDTAVVDRAAVDRAAVDAAVVDARTVDATRTDIASGNATGWYATARDVYRADNPRYVDDRRTPKDKTLISRGVVEVVTPAGRSVDSRRTTVGETRGTASRSLPTGVGRPVEWSNPPLVAPTRDEEIRAVGRPLPPESVQPTVIEWTRPAPGTVWR